MTTTPAIAGDQICVGNRVEFVSTVHGYQTGTVSGLMQNSALVEIDHELPGMRWAVPLAQLRPISGVA